MANSTKTRPPKRSAQRRPAPRPSRGDGFPVLPVAVGAVLVAIVLGLLGYVFVTSAGNTNKPTPQSVSAQYGCSNAEMLTQTHFHTHVAIYVGGGPGTGQLSPIPSQVGITGGGFCWLHTHDDSGIVHVEGPTSRAAQGFYLSDFLKVWQLTDPAATLTPPGEKVVVYINGKKVSTSPPKVQLKSLEDVTIEFLAPDQSPTPPTPFTWPAGFGA